MPWAFRGLLLRCGKRQLPQRFSEDRRSSDGPQGALRLDPWSAQVARQKAARAKLGKERERSAPAPAPAAEEEPPASEPPAKAPVPLHLWVVNVAAVVSSCYVCELFSYGGEPLQKYL